MSGVPRVALILAAGRGTRLGTRGEVRPKGFLELGGRPIVEESIERLTNAGADRIVVVTGHLCNFYEDLATRHSGRVETVHNPRYAESGSLYSLYCARERIEEDSLLVESDLVYERRALDVVCAPAHDDVILVSGPTDSRDEVWVAAAADGSLTGMGKDRARVAGEILGEFVGITRLSHPLLLELAAVMERRLDETLHLEYEADGLLEAGRVRPLHCELVEDLVWCEIDDEEHLRRARERVYPRIRERDGTGSRGAS